VQVAAFQIPSNKWWLKSSPPNVVHVRSVQHLVDEMAGAGERLVIVDVFAPWCAACKALYPKVRPLHASLPHCITSD
jgi:thiol-disulfide isomerase/thioredoxin